MKNLVRIVFVLTVSIMNVYPKEFIVALDIGHSPKKAGAISASGYREYNFNRSLTLTVYKELARQHIKAVFVNSSEKDIELKERTSNAKLLGASIFLSIHHDSVPANFFYLTEKHYIRGFGTFVSTKNKYFEQSLFLASKISNSLLTQKYKFNTFHNLRIKGESKEILEDGVYKYDDLLVLKTAQMPAVLIEAAVIANPNDEILATKQNYKAGIAKAIALAILEYQNASIK
ncbi:N-acetylmuramoyl-L-alanine amidase [Aquamicrobium sp.]|uniref:N-acetylmuramoyl-L-alanine amidase n=1 Tax=Aquamicrobium sp. TaxID=1872579 RepID=UPI0025902CE7|nr:N-acetylmuramoyl-L-alanine amidase [Aquamicrobium sp.]MCK9549290.1 N-acetylmuramoyl-L-alanine amidase [Aquamicrobium sp.]